MSLDDLLPAVGGERRTFAAHKSEDPTTALRKVAVALYPTDTWEGFVAKLAHALELRSVSVVTLESNRAILASPSEAPCGRSISNPKPRPLYCDCSLTAFPFLFGAPAPVSTRFYRMTNNG